MSLERIIATLVNLGLARLDAEVYVYIAKNGPKSVNDLENSLDYSKNQISKSLKKLVTIKLVNKGDPLFSAMPFEEALDFLIERQLDEQKFIENNKRELNSC